MKTFLPFCILLIPFIARSQDNDRRIQFPDIPGYQTLLCDFHIHTAFSDGSVWPDIRIKEAIYDGLDAIAMTEHLEYQPHSHDIPHDDRNRSYQVAKESAKDIDLIVINGVEVTREMPPGHSNAIFIKDANKLLMDDPMDVFAEAKNQGAFIFWNHPNWVAQYNDGVAKLTDMHRLLIKGEMLNGIEVVNYNTYSDEALEIALANNLTIMATSDIHELIDWDFDVSEGGHRPVTLVFADRKSEESIKEALFAGRTVAWHLNSLIGKEEYLVPLIENSLEVVTAKYPENTSVAEIVVRNNCDANYILKNESDYRLHANTEIFTLKAHKDNLIQVKTIDNLDSFDMTFQVMNASYRPKSHPMINVSVNIED